MPPSNAIPIDRLILRLEAAREVPAERALAIGIALVSAVRAHPDVGTNAHVEIVSLGQGSFRAELVFAGIAALAALGSLALDIEERLRGGEDNLAAAVAMACIENGATACEILTADTEIRIGASEIVTEGVRSKIRQDGAASGGFSDAFSPAFAQGGKPEGEGAPESPEGAAASDPDYRPAAFKAKGILAFSGDTPVVRTREGEYPLHIERGRDIPPTDRLTDFHLEGPSTRYGREYALKGWTIRDTQGIGIFTGRLLETDGGRAVTFEIGDERYAPFVPDDTIDWIPRGPLVEVKADIDEDGTIDIYDWRELAAGEDWNGEALSTEEGDVFGTESGDIIATEDGDIRTTEDGQVRVTENGRKRIVEPASPDEAGQAKPVTPATKTDDDILVRFEGAVFTGVYRPVLHEDGGDRLEIAHNAAGGEIPTAVPVVILARHTDIAPTENLVKEVIIVEEWWTAGNAPEEMKRREMIHGTLVRTTNGSFLINERGKTYRLDGMPAGDYRGSITLSGYLAGHKDVEGNTVFIVIDIEEY